MRALTGLVLPRTSHFCDIAQASSHRLRSTLAAAPVLFTHADVTVAGYRTSATPTEYVHRKENVLRQASAAYALKCIVNTAENKKIVQRDRSGKLTLHTPVKQQFASTAHVHAPMSCRIHDGSTTLATWSQVMPL